MEDNDIREIFETFDTTSTFKKDQFGNYKDTNVHNLWMGFKNWYKTDVIK